MVSPTLLGSSPLARGTRVIPESIGLVVGLIPARAGNTAGMRYATARYGAHPRSRGEHRPARHYRRRAPGSSPLARGTHTRAAARRSPLGLIPARAGNTQYRKRSYRGHGAHPRSRGEHLGIDNTEFFVEGSSPLARGTLTLTGTIKALSGLIPARAGNTVWGGVTIRTIRAHPRSRGEHLKNPRPHTSSGGSSPLARGTRSVFACSLTRRGLIPARAGNTC